MWDENKTEKEKSTLDQSEDWSAYYRDMYGREEKKWDLKGFSRIAVILMLFATLLFVRQSAHPLSVKVKDNLKYMLTTEWDYQPILDRAVQMGLLTANYDGHMWPGVPNHPGAIVTGTGNMELIVPVSGQVVRGFGWAKDPNNGLEKFHAGIDISTTPGSLVRAAKSGMVASVGNDPVLGGFVLVNHTGENSTLYAQVAEIKVEEGQEIKAGDVLGVVGAGGEVPGYGIHFEVRENGKLVDPLTKIRSDGQKW